MTHSIGTRSLMMMLPRVMTPPAPIPHAARARMKLLMLPASAHQVVASAKTPSEPTKSGLRPTASDRRPSSGWNADDVSRKAVDSHEAELEAWK